MDPECNTSSKASRITTPYLTRFEYTGVIGTRALQISKGAPIHTETNGEMNPMEIAKKELSEGKVCMKIKRRLPDGSYEEWGLDELVVDFERF